MTKRKYNPRKRNPCFNELPARQTALTNLKIEVKLYSVAVDELELGNRQVWPAQTSSGILSYNDHKDQSGIVEVLRK